MKTDLAGFLKIRECFMSFLWLPHRTWVFNIKLVLLTLIIFSCRVTYSRAEPSDISKADSLIEVLSNYDRFDTTRINILNGIAEMYITVERENTAASEERAYGEEKPISAEALQAFQYLREADSLAVQLNYPRGEAHSQRLLGDYYRAVFDYNQASTHYADALQIWTALSDQAERAREFMNIGVNHCENGAYPISTYYLDSALVVLQSIEDNRLLAQIYEHKGRVCYMQRQAEGVHTNYREALGLYKEMGDERAQVSPLLNIGIGHHWLGQHDSSQYYYAQGLALSKKLQENTDDLLYLARLLYNSGEIYAEQGHYPSAYENFLQSLDLAEKLNHKSLMSANFYFLAFTYRREGEYDKALQMYKEAEVLALEADDKGRLIALYNSIGCNYQSQCQNYEAMKYYDQALKVAEEIDDHMHIAQTYNLMGECNIYSDDLPAALFYLEKGLNPSVEIQSATSEAKAVGSLASAHIKLGQFAEARSYAQRTYDLAVRSNSKITMERAAYKLAISNEGLGRDEEAYRYLSMAKTLGDSLLGARQIRKLTTLEQQYQFDKEKKLAQQEQLKLDLIRDEREKRLSSTRNFLVISLLLTTLLIGLVYRNYRTKKEANAILAKEKKQVEETSALLAKSVITRDKILGMLSHDVLGMIRFTSITAKRLFSPSKNKTVQNEYQEYEDDLLESMDSLQGIIQKTLNWAKTQLKGFSIHQEEVQIHDLAEEVLNALTPRMRSNHVEYHNLLNQGDTIRSDQQLLFSILHNLLENEIKHGQAKKIHLKGQSYDRYYRMEISASGVIDASMLNTFFQSEDHSNYSHQGLGLFIVRDFITLLEARIEFIVHLKEKLHMIVIDLPYGDPVREPEQRVVQKEN